MRYTIELSSGNSEEYFFSKPADEDDYLLKPSHRKEYFEVATWVVDDFKEINWVTLVQKKNDENMVSHDEQKDSEQVTSDDS